MILNRQKTLSETDNTFKVLSKTNGDYVISNSWKQLFQEIANH